jgi:hypothetical protein
LAGLDDQGKFRRLEAKTTCLDRGDFSDSGAEGLHESRCCVRFQQAGLAVGVHLAFVVSAFMLAVSDRWSSGDQGGE